MNNLDECDPQDEPRTYRQQSYPKRMLVITAGSLMHLLIAIVLFVGIYSTAGRYGDTGELLIYGAPAVDSPAEKIGLREGDQILAVDNQKIGSRRELINAIVANKPGTLSRFSICEKVKAKSNKWCLRRIRRIHKLLF